VQKTTLATLTSFTTIVLAISSANAAFGFGNFEDCSSTASGGSGDTYTCVAWSGYTGEDGYNVDRFSTVASDGSKHSCTSFAAYMLYHENTHFKAISTFDSAQFWDNDASVLTGVTVGQVPHVGDIAQWEADSSLTQGHVAVVTAITMTGSKVESIQTADDNAGRKVTTTKVLFPGVNSGTITWPDHFITFPGFTGIYMPYAGSGGGKPAIAVNPIKP
jgi:surface antigen